MARARTAKTTGASSPSSSTSSADAASEPSESAALLPNPRDCYRAVRARDARFDGLFWFAVTTTGIYCRPSCPTPVHPRFEHTTFHATAAAAQRAGYRACKRCRPDAVPGSPLWDRDQHLAGRAMRLIADGIVDREGVAGLAQRLAVSTRHLDRVMSTRLGVGPLAIARAQRAHTARVLVESTDLRLADVAFASGFSSVRQFNDTMRAVYDRTPSELRARAATADVPTPGTLTVRLAYRQPLDVEALMSWFAARSIAGARWVDGVALRLGLRLAGGVAAAILTPMSGESYVRADFALSDLTDLTAAVERCRRLLDLDADPAAVADDLGDDPRLRDAVLARPGLRVPGSVDGLETAVAAIVGQQVSVAAAHAIVSRIVARYGPTSDLAGGVQAFPAADVLADADLHACGATRRGADAIRAVAALVADGLDLAPGADRSEVRARLLAVRGVGRWTADYVALRALRDPDVLPVGDLGVRRGAAFLGLPGDAAELERTGSSWSPWRSYVARHCWAAAASPASPREVASRRVPSVSDGEPTPPIDPPSRRPPDRLRSSS